ncbi:MAG: hypothetical protein MTP17_03075 [Candidatus Midichloria sp.]|nr:MAG: hypothetical protein MTP17_03075 [Candidatus Midichloria sp.]
MSSSLAENTASTALSILYDDIPILVINSITTLLNYTNNSNMQASQYKLYIEQKNESNRINPSLGLEILNLNDVEKLREALQKCYQNEFEHKTPKSELYATVVRGVLSKETLLQYTASHNPYINKVVYTAEEEVLAKQLEQQVQK